MTVPVALVPGVTTGHTTDHVNINNKVNQVYDLKADFGAIGGNSGDDGVTLNTAQATIKAAGGGRLRIPKDKYRIATPLVPQDGVHLEGMSSRDESGAAKGSILAWARDDGTHMWANPADTALAWWSVTDLQCIGPVSAGSTGTGDCFNLHGVYNNCSMERVEIRNFRGNGIAATYLTGGTDRTALSAVITDLFCVSVGGYGVKVDGNCQSHFIFPDFNHCMAGGFYFVNGSGNQCNTLIESFWWEGQAVPTTAIPVLLETMGGQSVVLVAPNINGAGSGDVIKVIGSSGATPVLVGGCGFGFTNWVNDTVANYTIPMANRATHFGGGVSATALSLASNPPPTRDIAHLGGTPNQRRWRETVSGSTLVGTSRNDAGQAVKTTYETVHASGLMRFPSGMATLVKAGPVGDGDFGATPPDGAMAVDSTNNRLYVRVGGTWKYSALT